LKGKSSGDSMGNRKIQALVPASFMPKTHTRNHTRPKVKRELTRPCQTYGYSKKLWSVFTRSPMLIPLLFLILPFNQFIELRYGLG
jgi:hypothetical protein